MRSHAWLRRVLPLLACTLTTACGTNAAPLHAASPAAPTPKYHPSAYSETAMDILTDDYGAFRGAPEAPSLGATIEDFTLPLADGGRFDMAEARATGDVVVVFFRGFW